MLIILSLACLLGLALGLTRLKVWTLIPATAIYGVLAAVGGVGLGLGSGRTVAVLFCVAVLLQAFYFVGASLADAHSDSAPATRTNRETKITCALNLHSFQHLLGSQFEE